jgi:SAM-dependent methyltransferase
MAHYQQLFFVATIKQILASYFEKTKVLEIGSLDINGSVRPYFHDCDYTGIDLGEGKGVDLICAGQDASWKQGTFDVVISCEAMEHNPFWQETWINMLRLVKNTGLVIMTCASIGRQQHGTQKYRPVDSPLTQQIGQDYYRNLTQDNFELIVNHQSWFAVHGFWNDHSSHDLYFLGVRQQADQPIINQALGLKKGFDDFYFKKNIYGEY